MHYSVRHVKLLSTLFYVVFKAVWRKVVWIRDSILADLSTHTDSVIAILLRLRHITIITAHSTGAKFDCTKHTAIVWSGI